MTTTATDIDVRYMISSDLPQVMAIELASFAIPWTEDELRTALRNRSVFGMVAERQERIVGFIVYRWDAEYANIWNIAVESRSRRHGVGAELMAALVRKAKFHDSAHSLIAYPSEANLNAHLFLRSQGFVCRAIERGVYHDTYEDQAEDAYVMVRRVQEPTSCNRIAKYFCEGSGL